MRRKSAKTLIREGSYLAFDSQGGCFVLLEAFTTFLVAMIDGLTLIQFPEDGKNGPLYVRCQDAAAWCKREIEYETVERARLLGVMHYRLEQVIAMNAEGRIPKDGSFVLGDLPENLRNVD